MDSSAATYGHEDTTIFTGDFAEDDTATESSSKRKLETLRVQNRMRLKKLSVFWPIKLSQFLCAVYIVIFTGLVVRDGKITDPNSEENTANGVIYVNGIYRPIVVETPFQMLCLFISRVSAFSLYPVMIAVFLTKIKALHNFLGHTPVSMYMIKDQHELHVYAGVYIATDVWVHTLFHLLRWGSQGNISNLWETRSGLSGLIVVVATPLITFPMMYWKRKIPYEIRKGLHYLFYLFAIGLCFHVPVAAVPNGGFIAPVLGFCICLYTVDNIYITLFMTEKIETTFFQVLSSGVKMTMDVSERFQKRGEQGGIAYVCLPWVSRNQWHAFSLFEHPTEANKREVFMLNAGDWTEAVHSALQRNTVRPVWVQGPFKSPYNNAESFDNQILVATGMGITPALSVIRAHKESRNINLIWAVRDAAMLEFFIEHLYLDHDGWNLIFYTGKTPLNPALEESNTNVRVIKMRPDLHEVIPNIIYGIESGTGLPEKYIPREIANVTQRLIERTRELDAMDDLTTDDKLKDLYALARFRGFLFTELINHLDLGDFDDLEDGKEKWDHPNRIEMHEEKNMDTPGDKSLETNQNNTVETCGQKHVIGETEHVHCDNGAAEKSEKAPPQTGHGSALLQRIRSFSKYGSTSEFNKMDSKLDSKMDSMSSFFSTTSHFMTGPRRRVTNFDNLRKSMPRLITSAFKPWEGNGLAKAYVRRLDQKRVLSTWGMLYCGGSAPVENALKHISEEYGVSLNCETFDW